MKGRPTETWPDTPPHQRAKPKKDRFAPVSNERPLFSFSSRGIALPNLIPCLPVHIERSPHMQKDSGPIPAPIGTSASPNVTLRRSPARSRPPGRAVKRLVLAVVLLAIVASGAALLLLPAVDSLRSDVITHTVQYGDLHLTFNEPGSLQSAANTNIVCRVKARTRGSTVASTLKWIIEEGTAVETGDVLAQLDDSGLAEDLRAQKIVVAQAHADLVQAEQNMAIVVSQNEGDIQSARVVLELAELDYQKYVKADCEQARQDILGRLSSAQVDVQMWRDRLAWSRRMLKKGYLTPNQVTSDKSGLASSEIALDNVREELRLLDEFTKRRTVTDLQSKVAEARRALERVQEQAHAKQLQAQIDRLAKESVLRIQDSRLHTIEEEIQHCTISAPHAGMVVYFNSEQSRYGSGASQGVIAQGEPVREGQLLMRIPDLTQMIVETQIHETMLAHVHGGERVVIRVHAFPDRVLHGFVKYVSAVPSLREWVWADRKVYPAKIAINEPPADLKPDMTADVTIEADRPLEHVLAVPVEAVVAPPKHGDPGKCFVMTQHGPQQREVVVGLSDTTMVEVKKGLEVGDEVVLNPATLLEGMREEGVH
jgi:HlyD family secretion protein